MRRLLFLVLALGCSRDPIQTTTPSAAIAPPAAASVESLAAPAAITATGEASRNIFAYREPPVVVRARVEAKHEQPQIQVMTTAPVPQPPITTVVEPSFTYRCIGTFGTETHRFAVFTNADGIVNAGIGEVVGQSEFVLREIGVESVMIEAKAGAFTRRIEIGR